MQKIFQVDAFSAKPFSGNPAAVCPLTSPASEHWMQQVAAEMNLSETAFLYKQDEKYNLRWFTPGLEVDLCGHATLASAHILWSEGYTDSETIIFSTKSGDLSAKKVGGSIELDFPATPASQCSAPDGLLEALGADACFVGKNRDDYLVEVASEAELLALQPDFNKLGELPVRGVIVTTADSDSDHDFLSRFFAPASGINEDPVTGSAHCTTGPYWSATLGKKTLRAYQASKRGGEITLTIAEDRVLLVGSAVTVLRGELDAPE